MPQDFTDDCYSGGEQAALSLQQFEDNFKCLKSNFSGSSEPSNPVGGMLWYNMAKNSLNQYDGVDATWRCLFNLVRSPVDARDGGAFHAACAGNPTNAINADKLDGYHYNELPYSNAQVGDLTCRTGEVGYGRGLLK